MLLWSAHSRPHRAHALRRALRPWSKVRIKWWPPEQRGWSTSTTRMRSSHAWWWWASHTWRGWATHSLLVWTSWGSTKARWWAAMKWSRRTTIWIEAPWPWSSRTKTSIPRARSAWSSGAPWSRHTWTKTTRSQKSRTHIRATRSSWASRARKSVHF